MIMPPGEDDTFIMLDERHDTNCREGQIKKEEAEKG
jgi:hypothetical protein